MFSVTQVILNAWHLCSSKYYCPHILLLTEQTQTLLACVPWRNSSSRRAEAGRSSSSCVVSWWLRGGQQWQRSGVTRGICGQRLPRNWRSGGNLLLALKEEIEYKYPQRCSWTIKRTLAQRTVSLQAYSCWYLSVRQDRVGGERLAWCSRSCHLQLEIHWKMQEFNREKTDETKYLHSRPPLYSHVTTRIHPKAITENHRPCINPVLQETNTFPWLA